MGDPDEAPKGAILDYDAIRREVDAEEWEDDDREGPGRQRRGIFLGTIMALYPSGKVYAPWSSNVDASEATADEAWREAADAALSERGLSIEGSEGDGCDLLVAEYRDTPDDDDDDRASVLATLRAMFEHAGAADYRGAMRAALGLTSWAALDDRLREAREAVETIMGEG